MLSSFTMLQTNALVFLTKKLWQYSVGNRGNVVFYFVLFLFANVIGILDPFVIAKILDVMQERGITHDTFPTITLLLVAYVGLQIAFWAFHGPARIIETRNAFIVRANFKKFLLDHTLRLPSSWHTDHHSGDTINKIEKATGGLFQYSGRTFEVIETVMRLLCSYAILAYFNLHATYLVVFFLFISFALVMRIDRILVAQYRQLNNADNEISAKIFDVISNITTVIILRIERLVASAIYKKIVQPFKLYRSNTRINELKWFLVSVSSALLVFFVLSSAMVSHIYLGTPLVLGTIYILYSYVQRIVDIGFRFAYLYGDIVQQKSAVMNADSLVDAFAKETPLPSRPLPPRWKQIEIKSLFFSYHTEEGSDLHLHDVDLTIKHGQRIALIGASGSGKTTMLKILRGLYEPQRIEVSLDGQRLTKGVQAMSASIALIPQDPEIFNATIRENITVGIAQTDRDIKRYTDLAQFTEVVKRLPHGLESSIVEKGVNLSGGEKQRLALARGLMASADKSIVLLDEPTSSVDLKNESSIYQNIFRVFKDKAIVSSIHRLHLLPLFDKIYFFDRGRVIASGSLEELQQHSPAFARLWKKYQTVSTQGLK